MWQYMAEFINLSIVKPTNQDLILYRSCCGHWLEAAILERQQQLAIAVFLLQPALLRFR